MSAFHIGIRIDAILTVGPSKDPKFPTSFVLTGGERVTTTGKWDANVAHIERKLIEHERALARIRSSRGGIDELDIAALGHLVSGLRGKKTYLTSSERQLLNRIYLALAAEAQP